MRETRCTRRSSPYYMNLATWSISCLRMKETRMENQCGIRAKSSVSAARKWNPNPSVALSPPRADAKRPRTRLPPGPGHETIWPAPPLVAQTRLIGTSGRIQVILCGAVVCSHRLVVDGWLRAVPSESGDAEGAAREEILQILKWAGPRRRPSNRRERKLFGPTAVRKVRNQGEDPDVVSGVGGDGYAQEPTEGPGH